MAVAVYKCRKPEGYEFVVPSDTADYDVVRAASEQSQRDWEPIPTRLVRVQNSGTQVGRALMPADLPWWGSDALVLTRTALNHLGSELIAWGEILPLRNPEKELFLFNCLTEVDALDEEHSDVKRFASGRIMRVVSYAFRADRLANAGVFKLPQVRGSAIYATDRFAEVLRESGLKGTEFGQVWPLDEHRAR